MRRTLPLDVRLGTAAEQAIVKRLKEERMGFDNQLAGIERTLKANVGTWDSQGLIPVLES